MFAATDRHLLLEAETAEGEKYLNTESTEKLVATKKTKDTKKNNQIVIRRGGRVPTKEVYREQPLIS